MLMAFKDIWKDSWLQKANWKLLVDEYFGALSSYPLQESIDDKDGALTDRWNSKPLSTLHLVF